MTGKPRPKPLRDEQFGPYMQKPLYSDAQIAAMESAYNEENDFDSMMRDPGVPTQSRRIGTNSRRQRLKEKGFLN